MFYVADYSHELLTYTLLENLPALTKVLDIDNS